MLSPNSSLRSAAPRFATPRRLDRPTYGGTYAKLARVVGTPFMPWQCQVADVAGEINVRTGRMAYDLVVVTVPRQAGKTSLVTPVALHTTLMPKGRAWYTAQTRADARDNWLEAVQSIETSAIGKNTRTRLTNGSEGLYVPVTRGCWRLFAPLPAALHGKQSDRVFLDEGWAYSLARGKELMQAVVPTQATRPAPQTWVLSTAGTAASEWLKALVTEGRAQSNPTMAYFEWSIAEDDDATDLDLVAAAHPAIGHTITRAALESAFRTLDDPDEFRRAYGNQWTSALVRVIDAASWARAEYPPALPMGGVPLFMGADLAPDRSYGSIAVACVFQSHAQEVSTLCVCEVIDHRPGVSWVLPRLRELNEKWKPAAIVLDKAGPSVTLVDELQSDVEQGTFPLVTTSSTDFAAACLKFYDGVMEGPTIRARPHPALDLAVAAAGKRPLAGAWAWSRSGGDPISPLIAATLAVWGVTRPEQPAPYVI